MRAESSFPDLEQQLVERRLSEYVLEFNRGQNLKPFSTSHVERSRIPAIPLTSKSLIRTAHYIDSIQICSKLKCNRKTAVIRLKSLCESFSHDSLFFSTSFLGLQTFVAKYPRVVVCPSIYTWWCSAINLLFLKIIPISWCQIWLVGEPLNQDSQEGFNQNV